MGWNAITVQKKKCPFIKNIPSGSYVYFVHSYYAALDDEICLAVTDYGIRFMSMAWKDNVYAAQFHPEKSQAVGLAMLKNFVSL